MTMTRYYLSDVDGRAISPYGMLVRNALDGLNVDHVASSCIDADRDRRVGMNCAARDRAYAGRRWS